jgi:hypothetical protein
MLDVHHMLARLHIGEEKLRRDGAVRLRSRPRLRLAPAEEFGVGEEVEIMRLRD